MHDLACSTQYLPVQHPVAIVLYSMQEYTVSNALEPIKRLRISLNYKRVYKGRIAASVSNGYPVSCSLLRTGSVLRKI